MEVKDKAIRPQGPGEEPGLYYAVQAADYIRESSSSGGALKILGDQILSEGGCICGALMDGELNVNYTVTDQAGKLLEISESQYIYCSADGCLDEIRKRLDSGVKVLFSGIPCQVARLKAFLGKEYGNLTTVDLICRGVTENALLKRYINENFGKKVKRVSFRDKSHYRWSSAMNIYFEDGTVYRETADTDAFLAAFSNGWSLMEPCNEGCPYNRPPRCGDISLGDFWGIDNYEKQISSNPLDTRQSIIDNVGTSLVCVNSAKGNTLFEKAKDSFIKSVPLIFEEASHNSTVNGMPPYDINKRRRFFDLINRYPISDAYTQVKNNKYGIGLVGLWSTSNYGDILTTMALYKTLENMGYQVVLIDSGYQLGKRENKYLSYLTDRCNISGQYRNSMELFQANQMCDQFIIGSGQCWNENINRLFDYMLMLNFVADGKRRISYSASFGFDRLSADEEERTKMQYYLSKFDAISVRELSGVGLCSEEFGVQATWTLDPIFLRDIEDYKKDAGKSQMELKEGYGLNYILDIRRETKSILHQLNHGAGQAKQVITVLGTDYTNAFNVTLENVAEDVDLYDFLKLYINCSYVVTDSYHGMCLAILFNKPFSVIINEGRGKTRFDTILEQFHLYECAVDPNLPEGGQMPAVKEDINWAGINARLHELQGQSLKWLAQALKCKPQCGITEIDLLRGQISKLSEEQAALSGQIGKLSQEQEALQKYTVDVEMQLMAEVEHRRKVTAKAIWNLFDREFTHGKKVLFRGGGVTTQKLIEMTIPLIKERNISVAICDSSCKETVAGGCIYYCISPEEMNGSDYDLYVVSSAKYRKVFNEEIIGIGKKEKLIDIYEELGMIDECPFFE